MEIFEHSDALYCWWAFVKDPGMLLDIFFCLRGAKTANRRQRDSVQNACGSLEAMLLFACQNALSSAKTIAANLLPPT